MDICRVRLPSEYITAFDKQTGESINIKLNGMIGIPDNYQELSTNFVKPIFNEYRETRFIIEGYIQANNSYLSRLEPGQYDFVDKLNLIVEFE